MVAEILGIWLVFVFAGRRNLIFSDKTLRDISAKKPVTKEAFSVIYGVGENKLRSYADIFIKTVINYKQKGVGF